MSGPEARRRPYPTHRLHATAARTCNELSRTVFQLQQPQMILKRTIFINLQQFYKSKQTN